MNNFEETRSFEILKTMLSRPPDLRAWVSGSQSYPDLFAIVYFYQMPCGVVVMAEAFNLPFDRENFGRDVFAFHIHEGFECSGNKKAPFSNALMHFNPEWFEHPFHAGDMPPLFGNSGYAWFSFFTDRFNINEICGRTIIIHRKPDDFVTQPSGNSGEKIACGVIESFFD